jgi:phage tail-like protein
MAAKRDRQFAQFNFLIDLGDGNSEGADAGFQECSGIGNEVAITEYRNGNDRENSVRKMVGLNKATDVTLKRGVIGSGRLYTWLNAIRDGDVNQRKTVRVTLQSEDHQQVVATWVLKEAQITKYTSGPFNAKGNDVAMEELTLTYERLEMEDVA